MPSERVKTYLTQFGEDNAQNKDMDNADLNIIISHGGWLFDSSIDKSIGSSLSVLGKSNNKVYWNNSEFVKYGASIGDNDTEWILTPACNSLGDEEMESRSTSNKETLDSYKELFANGCLLWSFVLGVNAKLKCPLFCKIEMSCFYSCFERL